MVVSTLRFQERIFHGGPTYSSARTCPHAAPKRHAARARAHVVRFDEHLRTLAPGWAAAEGWPHGRCPTGLSPMVRPAHGTSRPRDARYLAPLRSVGGSG